MGTLIEEGISQRSRSWPPNRLQTSLRLMSDTRKNWSAAHEGKFVLIHGNEIAGVWDTYQDALGAGYRQFGLDPFLVKQILSIERVQFFTRDLSLPHADLDVTA